MAILDKIDSNVTGLRFAEEASFKVLPGTPDWIPLEPNSYSDFGGEVTTVARNPINPGRQNKKGVVTDLDASGGFEMDVTQTNMQQLLQGFFFADLRRKEEYGGTSEITAVTNALGDYAGTGIEDNMLIGDMVFGSGFTNTENNGLKVVDGITGPDTVQVAETLVDEASPPAVAKLVVVGHQFAADDLNVVAGAVYPTITSDAAFDFTTLGLIPGEWLFVGGDTAATQFVTAGNNGFKRVRAVTATAITLDKGVAMTTESLALGETVQLFLGRVLKNETGSNIVRRTYNLERTLGAPDTALPAEVQAEYLEGQVPSEFALAIPTADKATATLSFVGADNTTVDGPTALKTGNRPALVEADAFNTSSDVPRIKMAVHSTVDEAPAALFAFVSELNITINNNLTPNKAVGVLGAFEVTAGTFQVNGEITAYFADVAAVQAVRNNADITLDMHLAKANAGISIDMPLITLGNGRLEVGQDEPITLPLSMDAATGAKLDAAMDHTLLMVFYDYLPTAAG